MLVTSTSARVVLFALAIPYLVLSIDIDKALQRRQNIPIGTAASPTSASPAAASTSPSVAEQSPSSSHKEQSGSSTQPSAAATITKSEPSAGAQPSNVASPSQSLVNAQSQGSGTNSQVTAAVRSQSSVTQSDTAKSASTKSSSKPVSSRTQQVVTTVVSISGSSTVSHVLTTHKLVAASESTSSTGSPSLDGSNGGSNSSGLSSGQKRTIIGVVVGVGGAMLIGGIAVVAWRIWGRKRNAVGEGQDLDHSQPGSSGREKTSSVSGNSPFRSTLDQYHHPSAPVNTASNF